jgi:hypothetical protein
VISQRIEHGQVWKPKGDRSTWYVATISPEKVGMSGPGPCRGMTYVDVDELLNDWEFVAAHHQKRPKGGR